jgi:prepilin-type N-terminal cleavage/methylation domain-containing protein
MKKLQNGFTLMELLIVISIIAILLAVVLLNVRGQIARAMDSKRKTDLYTLRQSFEDYYNDHNSFPIQSMINNCRSADMVPYLTQIPCDPETKSHYGYFPSANGGYRICTKLSDTTDPAIATAGCAGPLGCGLGGGYNYCLTSGVTASAVGTPDEITGSPTPTSTPGNGGGTPIPTPTPTPILNPINHIVCTNGGACNWYDNPSSANHRCPVSWFLFCPPGACEIAANRCAD